MNFNKNMKQNNSYYITTAIDYASGDPHIGHAYEKLAADTLARWNRNIKKDTFFQTGTDEHGQKVFEKAQEANKKVEIFAKEKTQKFKELCEKLKISYDHFIKTTDKEHMEMVQQILQKSYDNGDIYKDTYEGLYCVGCERYYTEKELIDGKICPTHKKETEKKKEENYFFKLSKYQDKLLKFYEENPGFISPKSKAQETINRVKEGLQDISISRHKNSLTWGIEIPFDKDHVTYVWFDALFNYYTGPKICNKDFWPADVHIIGHDISWFHVVYWPAFLMSVNYELPKKVFSHGMILDENGHKMSKSLGNVVDPYEEIEKFGLDEFRFYLLSSTGFGDDLNYGEKLVIEKINNYLNNDLGNLVSRVHSMTTRYFEGKVPNQVDLSEDEINLLNKYNIYEKFNNHMQELEFNRAIEVLWDCIRDTNAYINKVAPWKEQDETRLKAIINTLIFCVKTIADYVDCFMPNKAEMIRKQFNFEKGDFSKFENVSENHIIGEKENIFQKIKLEEKKEEKTEKIIKEGFEKLNLKIGKIIEIDTHPDAEKLYLEKIDVGEEKPRQIISGLKDYYDKEELIGKKVIVVAKLKPAKLRGILSEGMILAAEDENGNVGLVTSNEDIGTNISCENLKANNETQIKVDDFFQIKMISDGEKVMFENKTLKANNSNLIIDKNIKGNIR